MTGCGGRIPTDRAELFVANSGTSLRFLTALVTLGRGTYRLDGTPLGDPANIVLSEDNRTAYVINHHGAVNNAEFLQHGGRASVSVMDVKKMISATFDNTDGALEQSYVPGALWN